MLYNVDQAAIKLNVSKQSIYNKIKLKEYKCKTIKKSGKTYLDDELLNLIKDSLKIKSNIESQVENDNIENLSNKEIATDTNELLNLNKDLFNTLIEQLKEKDLQIQELNNRLATEQELTKNMQILHLKQHQPDTKALEDHFKEVDIKLLEIREQMQQRKIQQERKGIFKKIFKK